MNTTQTPANSKIRREQIMGLYDDDFEGGAERNYRTEIKTPSVQSMAGFQTPRFLKDTAGFAGKETLNLAKGGTNILTGILKEGLNLFKENSGLIKPVENKKPPEQQKKEADAQRTFNFKVEAAKEQSLNQRAVQESNSKLNIERIFEAPANTDHVKKLTKLSSGYDLKKIDVSTGMSAWRKTVEERDALKKQEDSKSVTPEVDRDLLKAHEGAGKFSAINAS